MRKAKTPAARVEWTPQQIMDVRNRELTYRDGTVKAIFRSFGGGWDLELRDHQGRRHREDNLDILSVCAFFNELQPQIFP